MLVSQNFNLLDTAGRRHNEAVEVAGDQQSIEVAERCLGVHPMMPELVIGTAKRRYNEDGRGCWRSAVQRGGGDVAERPIGDA